VRGLKPADTGREVALYHASPRDPVWEYVLATDQAADCLAVQAARVQPVRRVGPDHELVTGRVDRSLGHLCVGA